MIVGIIVFKIIILRYNILILTKEFLDIYLMIPFIINKYGIILS